jgi:hypothetical protein
MSIRWHDILPCWVTLAPLPAPSTAKQMPCFPLA